MSRRLGLHLRSNVVGYIALFFALTAGAYAVTEAPRNSVVSRSIKNGQVRTADLGREAVTHSKLAPAAIRAANVAPDSLTGAQIDEPTLNLGLNNLSAESATAGTNLPSIAAQSCQQFDFGPSEDGNFVLTEADSLEPGLVFYGLVVSGGEAYGELCNPTAAAIDPAFHTYYAWMLRTSF
jgi:hypothetical protein